MTVVASLVFPKNNNTAFVMLESKEDHDTFMFPAGDYTSHPHVEESCGESLLYPNLHVIDVCVVALGRVPIAIQLLSDNPQTGAVETTFLDIMLVMMVMTIITLVLSLFLLFIIRL